MKKFYYRLLIVTSILMQAGCSDEKTGCLVPTATNYDADATVADNCQCKYDGIYAACGDFYPQSINILPIQQETEVWCWLAVGEMIFRYYGLPTVNPAGDYQCGIVGALGYSLNGACDVCNMNCGNCIRPAGTPEMISKMLHVYPKVACKKLTAENRTLNSSFVSNYLSPGLLMNELNHNRPVIAGINPGSQFTIPGNSQHVALIKGYFFDSGNNLILRINDPYPYWVKGFDPYLFYGAVSNGDLSYQISFVNFVNGLKWNTSWFNIGW